VRRFPATLAAVRVAMALAAPPALGAQQTALVVVPPDAGVQWVDLERRGRFGYRPPRILQSVRDWPGTLSGAVRLGLRQEHLVTWAQVALSTGALIVADEWVVERTRQVAHHIGLPPNHPSYNVAVGPVKLIPIPTTLGSALYFLGDGATQLAIAGGFAAVGLGTGSNRARRTASQITEALLVAGTFTQILKHATGRQTPSEATVPRGRWQWFPSLADYNRNVPAHDAFPSGHLAVASATVEVIARNYPEKRLVRPVGYSLLTVLSFAMVNNGVHWASDYPLALAIGGGVAKVAVERGRIVGRPAGTASRSSRARGVRPIVAPGVVGLSLPFGR
jgi:hypothetical protein